MKKMMNQLEDFLEIGGRKKDITFLVLSGLSLLCSIFQLLPIPFEAAWIAIILCGSPIILEAIIGLITEFDIKADVLVSLALIASVCIGEYFAAGEIAFIMQLGALLEDLTVEKAQAGIEKLVNLTPQTARILRNEEEIIIEAKLVQVGDRVRVLPGETIPVDGVITAGQTSVNQAVITGESLPVDKSIDDQVFSGTVNQFGTFEMRADKVGEDSSIQRLIRLVESADAGKAEIVSMADRWATWIVVIALSAAALAWLISGEIIRAVTILVVFCPCALVLATPTAIMAAIGNAGKQGFLIREGDALERLATISKICFDKTGTLTYGTPEVVAVHSLCDNYREKEIYRLAAIAENSSEHPLGKSLVNSYLTETGQPLKVAEEFHMFPGKGVQALVEGKRVLAGNEKMMIEYGIHMEKDLPLAQKYLEEGCTLIYVAINDKITGLIALADTLREGMTDTMEAIIATGVNPVLLTGDNHKAANSIAKQLHIAKVKAECLPEDKLYYIEESQSRAHKICMVGDGINDAPALKLSHVGIAMGGIGSDVAIDAADIVLVDDRIEKLPHLLALSKKMMLTIKQNMTFSLVLNFIAIILAFTGILNPVVGALVHNAGSVLVIVNAVFLLNWKKS